MDLILEAALINARPDHRKLHHRHCHHKRRLGLKIAIIGSGYVGLVTGICLAEIGHHVICVDNDRKKISRLKRNELPIFEPGLRELLIKNRKNNRMSFTTSIRDAALQSTVIFIAVGTPSKENGEADLTFVENVSREIGQSINDYKLIVEKSTVPAATGKRIERTIRLNLPKSKNKHKSPVEFDVASNPEFLKEGSAVKDFMHPDRIVIGVESKRGENLLREIYKPLKAPIVVTDMNSAEMIKHASNSFLATKISFINAIAQICDKVGADVLKVAEGMGYDKRIGRDFLNAGIGYGGSCFPKDIDAFIRLSEKSGYDFSLLKEVKNINESQKQSFVKLVEDKLWIVKNKTIGILGLAFKPKTDDLRNAPSLEIIEALQKEGAKIKVYDPEAMEKAKEILKKVTFCRTPYDLAGNCDCLLIVTEWDEFRGLDFSKIKKLMKHPIIFDGRNLFDPINLKEAGFEYYGIGRGS